MDESVTMAFLGPFGFRSGKDVDKLANVKYKTGVTGCPMVTEHALSLLEARVEKQVDLGTHSIFIGNVAATEVLGSGSPLTYRFYREHLKGKTSPNAPTYLQAKP
jgi:flavin reductase (DIM6/NTAB) family NADH-FMN oxidoreductase RutF